MSNKHNMSHYSGLLWLLCKQQNKSDIKTSQRTALPITAEQAIATSPLQGRGLLVREQQNRYSEPQLTPPMGDRAKRLAEQLRPQFRIVKRAQPKVG